MSLLQHLFLPHHTNNQRARILHPTSLGIIIGIFAVFQVFLTQISRYHPDILGYASQISPAEVIRLTNIQRANNGLQALKTDAQLSAAAAQKASDMFAKNYWAHISPTGTQPWYFITQSGYIYRYAGENLARDFADPNSVVNAWMNSPTHRENLLSNRYSDIGVAVVDGNLSGHDTTLVVQMFGTRLSANTAQVSGASAVVAKAVIAPITSPKPALPTGTIAPTIVPTLVPVVAISQPNSPQSNITQIDPFKATKVVSLIILGILAVVLIADVFIVNQKKLYRWTSKSFAHFIFIGMLIIAATTIIRGQIL